MIEYEIKEVPAPDRVLVKVLGATFESGRPSVAVNGRWRSKLQNREEMLGYLKYNERYLYGEGIAYGSEKRKNPA